MEETLVKGARLIAENQTQAAIEILKSALQEKSGVPEDRILYQLGNAYRKEGNWQEAIQYYLEAMELNPNSPAAEAYRMAMDILNFYNKDMFNQ